jgi:hypothetical protein
VRDGQEGPDRRDVQDGRGGQDGRDERDGQNGREAPRVERASLRPSRPPHAPHPLLGAARLLFMLVWVGLQSTLILTADRRADSAFGFRMLDESNTMRVVLFREVVEPGGRSQRIHVDGGTWQARGEGGVVRRFSWYDRVPWRELGAFDREIPTPWGARAQVERLQAALDDVARHVPEDAETRRLLLEVTIRHNGREPQVYWLASEELRTHHGGA